MPGITLRLQKQIPSSYPARFGTAFVGLPAHNSPWFSRRLDVKVWSEPTRQSDFALEFLAPGRYALEVRAISAAGRPKPTPARLQQLIAQLGAPDFNRREIAVRALVRQRAAALPPLRAALAKAAIMREFQGRIRSESAWWLETAIQEADRPR